MYLPDVPRPSSPLIPSIRFLMIFLTFSGITVINCGFAAFNFGIVCTVNGTKSEKDTGDFNWNKVQQSNLLAAYAWGALVTAIPSGWLSDKYGGKYVFLTCILLNLISSAVSPWAAYHGLTWIFIARVVCGMASGGGWPCVISIVTRWTTQRERSTLLGFALSGTLVGQLITVPISGILCSSEAGWPAIFYTWAGLSGLVSLVWCALYTDYPDRCSFINPREVEYLSRDHREYERRTVGCERREGEHRKTSDQKEPQQGAVKQPRIPWRHVLFSTTSCSIYLCHICNAWMGTFMNEFVPTYSREVLNLDMQSNGFYSALPLLTQVISYCLSGALADRTCRSCSVTFSVKLFNTLCMGVPIGGLMALAFLDRDTGVTPAIVSLCVCTFFYATCVAGFVRSMVLIAPPFSGTISSVSNFWSYVGCIIMPYVTGLVTQGGTVEEWHNAFYIGVAVSALGCLEFLILGSGEEQKWARLDMQHKENEVNDLENVQEGGLRF